MATNNPLTIWCNAKFPTDAANLLREGVGPNRLLAGNDLQGSNLTAGAADALLADANVIFGQPPVEALTRPGQHLKWVHLTTAGYERYDRADVRKSLHDRGVILTNSSHVYDEPCAQHVLAMMLSISRQLPPSLDNQRADHAWRSGALRAGMYLLRGQSALMLGFGAIGQRLAEMLRPFEMKLAAVRRSVRGDEAIPTYAEGEVDRLLSDADHVINVLPGGDATRLFLTAGRIAMMKPSAIFYNVGRGGTVDQEALLAALQAKRIAAAYLDVTSPEPLPPEHPLWTAPNCYITPHTAGGHQDEHLRIVRHFVENLRRLIARQPMVGQIL